MHTPWKDCKMVLCLIFLSKNNLPEVLIIKQVIWMSCTMPPAPFEHNSLPSIPNKLFMFMLKKKEKLASTIIEIQRTICVLSRKSFRFFFQQIQKHIVPFICHIIPPNMNSTLVFRWFIQCQTHKKTSAQIIYSLDV